MGDDIDELLDEILNSPRSRREDVPDVPAMRLPTMAEQKATLAALLASCDAVALQLVLPEDALWRAAMERLPNDDVRSRIALLSDVWKSRMNQWMRSVAGSGVAEAERSRRLAPTVASMLFYLAENVPVADALSAVIADMHGPLYHSSYSIGSGIPSKVIEHDDLIAAALQPLRYDAVRLLISAIGRNPNLAAVRETMQERVACAKSGADWGKVKNLRELDDDAKAAVLRSRNMESIAGIIKGLMTRHDSGVTAAEGPSSSSSSSSDRPSYSSEACDAALGDVLLPALERFVNVDAPSDPHQQGKGKHGSNSNNPFAAPSMEGGVTVPSRFAAATSAKATSSAASAATAAAVSGALGADVEEPAGNLQYASLKVSSDRFPFASLYSLLYDVDLTAALLQFKEPAATAATLSSSSSGSSSSTAAAGSTAAPSPPPLRRPATVEIALQLLYTATQHVLAAFAKTKPTDSRPLLYHAFTQLLLPLGLGGAQDYSPLWAHVLRHLAWEDQNGRAMRDRPVDPWTADPVNRLLRPSSRRVLLDAAVSLSIDYAARGDIIAIVLDILTDSRFDARVSDYPNQKGLAQRMFWLRRSGASSSSGDLAYVLNEKEGARALNQNPVTRNLERDEPERWEALFGPTGCTSTSSDSATTHDPLNKKVLLRNVASGRLHLASQTAIDAAAAAGPSAKATADIAWLNQSKDAVETESAFHIVRVRKYASDGPTLTVTGDVNRSQHRGMTNAVAIQVEKTAALVVYDYRAWADEAPFTFEREQEQNREIARLKVLAGIEKYKEEEAAAEAAAAAAAAGPSRRRAASSASSDTSDDESSPVRSAAAIAAERRRQAMDDARDAMNKLAADAVREAASNDSAAAYVAARAPEGGVYPSSSAAAAAVARSVNRGVSASSSVSAAAAAAAAASSSSGGVESAAAPVPFLPRELRPGMIAVTSFGGYSAALGVVRRMLGRLLEVRSGDDDDEGDGTRKLVFLARNNQVYSLEATQSVRVAMLPRAFDGPISSSSSSSGGSSSGSSSSSIGRGSSGGVCASAAMAEYLQRLAAVGLEGVFDGSSQSSRSGSGGYVRDARPASFTIAPTEAQALAAYAAVNDYEEEGAAACDISRSSSSGGSKRHKGGAPPPSSAESASAVGVSRQASSSSSSSAASTAAAASSSSYASSLRPTPSGLQWDLPEDVVSSLLVWSDRMHPLEAQHRAATAHAPMKRSAASAAAAAAAVSGTKHQRSMIQQQEQQRQGGSKRAAVAATASTRKSSSRPIEINDDDDIITLDDDEEESGGAATASDDSAADATAAGAAPLLGFANGVDAWLQSERVKHETRTRRARYLSWRASFVRVVSLLEEVPETFFQLGVEDTLKMLRQAHNLGMFAGASWMARGIVAQTLGLPLPPPDAEVDPAM